MKLKYYLRGLGIGVVLTSVIMGVVLGKGSNKISDEEVIRRAKQLGMVEAESTLSSYTDSAKNGEDTDEVDNAASGQEMDKAGEEISEEVNEGEPSTGEPVPEVDTQTKESSQTGESSESVESEEDVKLASNDAAGSASTDVVETGESTEATAESTENQKNEQEVTTEQKTVLDDNTPADSAAPASDNTNPEPAAADTPATNQQSSQQPAADSSDVNYIVVVLPSGSESDTCARILRESGVIEDGVAFNNYLVSSGLDRKIRSGTKQIPKGASFEEIASAITR